MKNLLVYLLLLSCLVANANSSRPCVAWIYPGHFFQSIKLTGTDVILVACAPDINYANENINDYTEADDPINMVPGEYIAISAGDGEIRFKCVAE